MNETVAAMARIVDYDLPPDIPRSELPALVGGKAAGLTVMAVDLELPVPPAFTLTTAVCRDYLAHGWPDGLDDEIRAHMARLEEKVGRRFGDPDRSTSGERPFRSARVDARDDGHAAQRRVGQRSVGRAARGDRIGLSVVALAARHRVPGEGGHCRRPGHGGHGPGDGLRQPQRPLRDRRPVHAQPGDRRKELYGDVLFNAQGEEVVSGTRDAEPIGVLRDRLPDVAAELAAHSDKIERHLRDAADIEFTIEDGRLWMLQCRVGKRSPQAALRMAVEMAEDPDFPLSREEAVARVATILADPPRVADAPRDAGEPLTTGLGASPGVASGEVVTSPDAAVAAADAGRAVILVRRETSPDDVHGMARAAGILTSTGGLACHAAVVARGWGVPAVVGATALTVEADGFALDGRRFAVGEVITIDGSTGEVFARRAEWRI